MDRKEQAASVPDACQEPVRSSLAVLSVHNKPRAQQSSAAGAFALARPKRKATGNPGKENNGGLEIFVDDEFKPGNPEPGPLPAAPVTGLWTKLGGFEQNRQVWRCSLSLCQARRVELSSTCCMASRSNSTASQLGILNHCIVGS